MTKQTTVRPTSRPIALQQIPNDLEALYSILGMQLGTATRLPVTETTVRGLPAAWAALAKISNAVGQMMVGAVVVAADGITEIATPPVVDNPDVTLDSFTYWKMAAATAVCRGNYIALKADFDLDGFPRQAIGVPADAVNVFYDEAGFVIYQIGGIDYGADDVVHVRCGITVPGNPLTIGVIEAHRRGLAGAIDQQGMSNSVWREGAIPTGVVELDTKYPTKDQVDIVKSGWVSLLEGRRTVAVTGTAMKYTPLSWSADDAQFIESQQLTIAQIALMFSMSPTDLDASIGGSGLTYSNRSDNALQRIVDVYAPVMLPIEQAWSRLVIGRSFVRGNPEALLRSSTRERYELHKLAQDAGIETTDESRAIEGKGPAEPPPPPPPPPPAMDPPNPDGSTP